MGWFWRYVRRRDGKKIKKIFFQLQKFFRETILNFVGRSKTKKRAIEICKGTLDIERERDWSVGLSSTLDDGQKIKNYFSSFRDFSGKSRQCDIVGLRMFYKPTKFNQNLWNYFEKIKIYIFFM